MELHWEGGNEVYTNGPGQMTKMAATSIYCKKPLKSFPTINSPMTMKLGLEHYVFKLYKVYINNDRVDLNLFYDKFKLMNLFLAHR